MNANRSMIVRSGSAGGGGGGAASLECLAEWSGTADPAYLNDFTSITDYSGAGWASTGGGAVLGELVVPRDGVYSVEFYCIFVTDTPPRTYIAGVFLSSALALGSRTFGQWYYDGSENPIATGSFIDRMAAGDTLSILASVASGTGNTAAGYLYIWRLGDLPA